jgi:hypothetical protein
MYVNGSCCTASHGDDSINTAFMLPFFLYLWGIGKVLMLQFEASKFFFNSSNPRQVPNAVNNSQTKPSNQQNRILFQ